MYKNDSGHIVFSPSDLMVFMESEFASMMDRHYREDPERFKPDEQSATNEILAKRGDDHEKNILAQFQSQGQTVVVIDDDRHAREAAFEETRSALDGDADIIFQAVLRRKSFTGLADFLIRNRETGAWEVWDTKLARSVKPKFLIQLCSYAEMLSHMTGVLPETIGIILGDGTRKSFQTRSYFSYYRQVKSAFLEHLDTFDVVVLPEPTGFGTNGRWETIADEWLVANDHISLVANIRQTQVKRLADVDIRTMSELAASNLARVKGIGDEVFVRLRDQARLQLATGDSHAPEYEVVDPPADGRVSGFQLLPPASELDVFFDMEGYPLEEGGLEYLFGVSTRDDAGNSGNDLQFHDWWAYDKSQEKKAFEDFVDWAYERWQRDPSMHIYHYAHYEVTALTRLMGDYATRENKIDNLLRGNVFVDLYQVVRQGLCIGTASYSIKYVERLYREARSTEVGTAVDSIVAFDQWTESGEPADWKESDILHGIRDYNEDDCVSTLKLADWLRARQSESGIDWIAPEQREDQDEDAGPRSDSEQLAVDLLDSLPSEMESPTDEQEVTQMLGWVLEYHRREAKPQWWSYFSRASQSFEELYEDMECLAGLKRTGRDPVQILRSLEYEYTFDNDQESKVMPDKRYSFAENVKNSIAVSSVDYDAGIIKIKQAANKDAPPPSLDLVPGGPVNYDVIVASILGVASRWKDESTLQPAIQDFLLRREPTIDGRSDGESVIHTGEDLVNGTVRAVGALQESVLCIQGPPGCGKTHVAAHSIVDLIGRGKRVGVTSNSHKAIINLLNKVSEVAAERGSSVRGVKIGPGDGLDNEDDFAVIGTPARWIPGESGSELVAGATAWAFSREDWAGKFDYLFVDEAGQVSLANLVAMAPAAENIVIIGDQMQLEQPLQGSHPGHSGESIMEYFLHGHPTVPPERGILLDASWRMHPGICDFISEGVYEGRLTSAPHCEERVVEVPATGTPATGVPATEIPATGVPATEATHITRASGIIYLPVEHSGNSQSSEEEAQLVVEVASELIGRTFTPGTGGRSGSPEAPRPIALADILFVAPYNMQVNLLKSKLPTGARVASVDKFQGQEAPIVILSMCASSTDDITRGMDFLLSKNRLNVAVSRAQSLAIVVASPKLQRPSCSTVAQIELANFFCRLVGYAENADELLSSVQN